MSEPYVPEHFAKVTHAFSLGGDPEFMYVTYGVQLADPGSGTGQDLADDLHTAATNELLPMTAKDYQLRQTEVAYHVGPLWYQYVAITTATSPSVSVPAPQNCALLVHKRTAIAGRKYRGRLYVPGVAEGSVNGIGALDSTYLSALQSRASAFLTAVQGVTDVEDMVLFHVTPDGGVDLEPTVITNLQVDGVIATQRRRLRP